MIKMIRFLKPFTLSIVVIVVLIFCQALAELILPALMANIVDIGIVKGEIGYIFRTGGIMVFVAIFGAMCKVCAGFLSSKTAMGLGKILRSRVFGQVEKFSLQEYEKFGTASLIIRSTNDIQQVQSVTLVMLNMVLSAPIMCIGGIIMAVRRDSELSWVLIGAVPILAIIISLIAKKAVPLYKALQEKLDKLNLVLHENLVGIRVIRAFSKTEFEKKRFKNVNDDLTDTAIRVNRVLATMMPTMMLVMNITTVAIIWFGGIRIESGKMQVGDMMAFIQYGMLILMSLLMFSIIFVMLPRASVSAARILEVLETEPKIVDVENPAIVRKKKGNVEFDNVSFEYPGAENPAVSGISFVAKPGEVTAIIGGTGAGKSTLVNLLMRFYDVKDGSIRVDDVDIRKLEQAKLREMIGFVPQKPLLFSGTILDNIKFGNETAPEEYVHEAAEIAQAKGFIEEIKEGYEAFIAQGGVNVSGGQKQRISIARAIVRKPQIYVFDDSFSALDFKTDAMLRKALMKETKDATVIVVAQRIGTIMEADRIIVLDKGKIAGMGKHKELICSNEVYREIVASQLSREELP